MPSPPPAASATDDNKPKPRRFLPEPIETTTKSSKTARQRSPEKKAEAAAPRRFAPQPIEHSTKSSRSKAESQDETPKPRRFAPQLVEESRRSSSIDKTGKHGHIRFNPEPIEILQGSNRKSRTQGSRQTSADSISSDATPKPARKWAPEVIDTAKRSRRNGNEGCGESHDYRTEHGHSLHAREHRRHITGYRTPAEPEDTENEVSGPGGDDCQSPYNKCRASEPRRQMCALDGTSGSRLTALTQTRSHSFHVPELDTIESSESEPEDDTPSRSSGSEHGSPITASDSSFEFYKHATRRRESVDENVIQYMLQLQAKEYQQRLQDQALAAFPNSDYHEPIQHFINDDEDSDEMEIDERPVTWSAFDEEEILQVIRRRESTTVPWDQLEMQRHAEKKKKEDERNAMRSGAEQQSKSPWWNPVAGGLTMYQQDSEITSMRDRARPPMLGCDLVFPRCPSPEPARFDTTQRSGTVSTIGSIDSSKRSNIGGLWQPAKRPESSTKTTTTSTTPSSPPSASGLWGGHCVRVVSDNAAPTAAALRSGLMTPQVESVSNPFEQSFANTGGNTPRRISPQASHVVRTPPTPPTEVSPTNIDAIVNSSMPVSPSVEKEYPDTFVTQVFNYLSLGYPSLARPFDEELSKISRIPVATLRKDDVKARASPRGYIRLGSDFEGGDPDAAAADGDAGFDHAQCVRWLALKLYVREWVRQERGMAPFEMAGGNWGTGARRGSWAI